MLNVRWARRSGTDTESDDNDYLPPLASSAAAAASSGPHSTAFGQPHSAAEERRQRFIREQIRQGSPQLSLAEFLRDG